MVIFDANDIEQLERKLQNLITDEQLRSELGAFAYEDAHQNDLKKSIEAFKDCVSLINAE